MGVRNMLCLGLLAASLGASGTVLASDGTAAADAIVQAADEPQSRKMSEQAFREDMLVADINEVRYQDEAGEALSFDQFVSLVLSGRAFNKMVDADKSLAVMTIKPEGTPGPGEAGFPRAPALNFAVSTVLPSLEPTLVLVSPEGRLMGVRSSYHVPEDDEAGRAELEAWMRSLGA